MRYQYGILGLTAIGRATVLALQLNNAYAVKLDKHGYLRDGIHPIAKFALEIGIVVGRLHHEGCLSYKRGNDLMRKIDWDDFST